MMSNKLWCWLDKALFEITLKHEDFTQFSSQWNVIIVFYHIAKMFK